MKENIGLFLTKRALLNPDHEALVETEPERRLTYRQLNGRCNQAAHGLAGMGLQEGDRVALLFKNSAEYVELFFALAKMGAIMVPLNWRLAPPELEFILSDSGTVALAFDSEFEETARTLHRNAKTPVQHWISAGGRALSSPAWESYRQLKQDQSQKEPEVTAQGDDLLFIIYTSGTTGLPKGAMHSHASQLWASLTWMAVVDLRPKDRMLLFLPPFHVGVILPLVFAFHRGITAVLLREFNVQQVFETFEREEITTSISVPTMLKMMLDWDGRTDYDFSRLRWIILGAGAVPAPLLERYSELGVDILQDYGLTESCGPATLISPEEAVAKPASAGKACFHSDVRVIGSSGQELEPNTVGEVVIRAPHVMEGYWNQPEATREVIRDGWLHTGDLGRMDEDGCLFIVDRKKDLIISGGENIYPAEIENLLLHHPAIKEVAVIAQPSEKWGESPAAVVALEEGEPLDMEALRDYCRGQITNYKVPKTLEVVEKLPRTPTGKIQKHLLREHYSGPAPE